MNNENKADQINEPLEENGVSNEPTNAVPADPLAPTDAPSQKPKRKPLLLLTILGIVVVLAVAAIFLFGGSFGSTGNDPAPIAIPARMSADGTAYIPLMDGSCIQINDEVENAFVTGDRNHVVVHLRDGILYVTDIKQSSKTQIADNCASLNHVTNDGFIYIDKDETTCRVLFDDMTPLKVGEDITFVTAENTTSILYATDEGNIYTLANTDTDANKIATFDDTVELEAVSDDGQISVWVILEDDSHTIMLNDGDDRSVLGEIESESNYTYVTFSKDQKLVTIDNSYSDCIWIKRPGEDPIKAKLGGKVFGIAYTEHGHLKYVQADEVSSLYFYTLADTGINVYSISMTGDRERILSKVLDFKVSNGNIFYTDQENTLYYAHLSEDSISEETKIASNVDFFEVPYSGQYVYYMKNCDENDNAGSLYCYKLGEADPLKIATDVACFYFSYGSGGYTYNMYSLDGSDVFFFQDMEEIPDTYDDHGTLFQWSYGAEDPVKIASEVLRFSVSSRIYGGVYADSFIYTKYLSVDEDENVLVNWMYYDGKESTKFAAEVIG